MNNQLLLNALNNYDNIIEKSKKYFLQRNLSNISDKSYNQNFKLYHNNNEITNNFEIETIGSYISKDNIWVWGWIYDKTKLFEIVNWCYNAIDKNTLYNIFIKTIFSNGKFIISDSIQIDIILALSSYLYKTDVILSYNVNKDDDLITYFSIKFN